MYNSDIVPLRPPLLRIVLVRPGLVLGTGNQRVVDPGPSVRSFF